MPGVLVKVEGSQALPKKGRKVTVVGVGSVGMAVAYAIMVKELATEIALVDIACERVKGEVMDLKHGKQFVRHCNVIGSTVSAGSDIVFVTAGARQQEGESRLNLVQKNVNIFKGMIPQIARHSPCCILIIVTNPVDILTSVAARLSGFPPNRVIGTGTMLDSSRFRTMLGEVLGVSPSSVHALIIGEHGDSSVPVWSKVSVAGVPLSSLNPLVGKPNDPENYGVIHKNVVDSAYQVIKLKGQTSWAIGLTCYALANAILNNAHTIYPLTTCVKGFYNIQDNVYLSLPVLVTANGAEYIVPLSLSPEEEAQLRKSANALAEVTRTINWCS
ncbi:unnamed protein product [Echinostoma caproni]|uniref:L-lactate dehydrogenase n=1 Tax=Echinostoma caproni TaxID=27848 RepID=A0A183AG81_9TREM|nr:unnamed protein product [Echinostoma caproni]